jgi:hypothetical protein
MQQLRTLDDHINDVMEPVTKGISAVIFFSLPIGEEVVVERWDKKTKRYRMVLDGTNIAAEVDQENDPLLGVPVYVNTTDTGLKLEYAIVSGKDTSVFIVNDAQPGQMQELRLPGGSLTTLKFSGNPEVFESGKLYRISHRNVEIPFVLIWLIVGALFFTFFFRFVNISGFRHAIDVVRGKYDDPDDAGEVSHFQALTAALSGTVGIGNIAGVAVAVSLGGPGATFWMIIAGLLGMSAKFIECTLGVKYRKINPDGSVSGGPMYYLSEGLKKRGFGNLGKVLAILFAVACIGGSFGGGNMVQINQATVLLTQLEELILSSLKEDGSLVY